MAASHVAFVRAVMIGREGLHRDVLLGMFERAGARDTISHSSTGNVSFVLDDHALAHTIGAVEADLERLLGRPTTLFFRSVEHIRSLLDLDPFADAPFDEVAGRIVTFFRAAVPPTIALPMTAPNGDWVVFAGGVSELFSVTRAWPDRHPTDPGGAIQRAAGEPVTTRALGTLERIVRRVDNGS